MSSATDSLSSSTPRHLEPAMPSPAVHSVEESPLPVSTPRAASSIPEPTRRASSNAEPARRPSHHRAPEHRSREGSPVPREHRSREGSPGPHGRRPSHAANIQTSTPHSREGSPGAGGGHGSRRGSNRNRSREGSPVPKGNRSREGSPGPHGRGMHRIASRGSRETSPAPRQEHGILKRGSGKVQGPESSLHESSAGN
jgi:hypothetical protein